MCFCSVRLFIRIFLTDIWPEKWADYQFRKLGSVVDKLLVALWTGFLLAISTVAMDLAIS